MKFSYYSDTDSLYIELSANPGVDSLEVAPGVVVDFDVDGEIVGIDIDHALKVIDLSRLDAEGLPLPSLGVGAR